MDTKLDQIRTEFRDAEPVLKALDAQMEAIAFDPLVLASVDAAVAEVEQVVDNLMAPFRENPVLGPVAAELTMHYLENIQSVVAQARK